MDFESYTYQLPCKLWNHEQTYNELMKLQETIKDMINTKIIISFESVIFIQINILAILGCIFEEAKLRNNSVLLSNMNPRIKKILNFYYFNTSSNKENLLPLRFQKYTSNQHDLFIKDLKGLLFMVEQNQQIYVINRILELFDNTIQYSLTNNHKIYVSGYCNQNADWVYLSIGNLGKTFYDNLNSLKKVSSIHKDQEAILWGCTSGNSTKDRLGMGLSMLCEEVIDLKGYMWIMSGRGYIDLKKGHANEYKHSFNGTFITIGIPLKT